VVEFGISNGNIIGYVDADGDNTLSNGDRIVFQLSPNGSDFTFTLLDQIDHPIASLNGAGAGGDGELLGLDLSGAFLATDKDGDKIVLDTAVTVNVEDDIPVNLTAAPVTVSVQEDALDNADPTDANNDHIFGSTGNSTGEGTKTTIATIL